MIDKVCKALGIILLIAGLISVAIFLNTMYYNSDMEIWNNGICDDCSGEWQLKSVTAYKYNKKIYLYQCENCKIAFESNFNFFNQKY